MEKTYKVLSIAGSDPSGGAGIQADIKTITSLGGYAATAITAVTVQNTLGVKSVFAIPPQVVSEQIDAVMEDIEPQAIKIGMVKDVQIVRTIADAIKRHSPQIVIYDPVMVSTSGHKLIDDDVIDVIENELIPLSTLITPNLNEAEVLLGRRIEGVAQMDDAAAELSDRYGINVLIKGGHLSNEMMSDVLCRKQNDNINSLPDRLFHFTAKRVDTRNLHGTGCTLSSAIATFMAKGCNLQKAIAQAKEYVTCAIEAGCQRSIGHGNGPLWHLVNQGH